MSIALAAMAETFIANADAAGIDRSSTAGTIVRCHASWSCSSSSDGAARGGSGRAGRDRPGRPRGRLRGGQRGHPGRAPAPRGAVGPVATRVRLDRELVRRGLAPSREAAGAAIRAGRVLVGGAVAAKASTLVSTADPVALAGEGTADLRVHRARRHRPVEPAQEPAIRQRALRDRRGSRRRPPRPMPASASATRECGRSPASCDRGRTARTDPAPRTAPTPRPRSRPWRP